MSAILYVLPGGILAAIGFVLFFGLLVSMNALSRSRQFGAIAEAASGRAGAWRLAVLGLAVFLLVAGALASFAGVMMSDASRSKACVASCASRGYTKGVIRGSTAKDPKEPRHNAFVACACEGGASPPIEFPASDLAK